MSTSGSPETDSSDRESSQDDSPSDTNGSNSTKPGGFVWLDPMVSRKTWFVFLMIAILGGAADLISKQVVFQAMGLPGDRAPWWLIEGHVGIETAVNLGAVFGFGQGRGGLFAAFSVFAGLGVFAWMFRFGAGRSPWLTVALGCVMAGIIGNLYDRLGLWWKPGMDPAWKSGVRDWILLQYNRQWRWPNFNIADSMLVVGACMMLYRGLFFEPVSEPDSSPGENDDPQPQSEIDS
ncbi:MAG: signal peptidase II [Planctomycetota bacterium]